MLQKNIINLSQLIWALGDEIKIKDLVDLIKKMTGFSGVLEWDGSKPDGQPRRKLDTTRAEKEFGFVARYSFQEGMQNTINWYIEKTSNE